MTTVINLNLLNFIRLKLNKFTVNDIRFNTQVMDRRDKEPSDSDLIIDVTPRSQASSNNEIDFQKNTRFPVSAYHHAQPGFIPDRAAGTYDRQGKAVPESYPKGMHVNSYA